MLKITTALNVKSNQVLMIKYTEKREGSLWIHTPIQIKLTLVDTSFSHADVRPFCGNTIAGVEKIYLIT